MTRSWEDAEAQIEQTLNDLRGQAAAAVAEHQLPPRRKRAKPDPAASDADKLAALRDELRALISDAHAATKDLSRQVAAYRMIVADAARELPDAMALAANAELMRWANHVQREQNKHTADLQAAVVRAREMIIARLFEARLVLDDSAAGFRFEYTGAKFIADGPDPYPEAGLPEGLSGPETGS